MSKQKHVSNTYPSTRPAKPRQVVQGEGYHLISPGLARSHFVLYGLTWSRMVPLGHTRPPLILTSSTLVSHWFHTGLDLFFPWSRLVSYCRIWSHFRLLGLTWSRNGLRFGMSHFCRLLLNGSLTNGGLVRGPFRFRKLKIILKHLMSNEWAGPGPRKFWPGSRPGPIHLISNV